MTSFKGLSVVNLPRAQSEFTIRAFQRGDALQARRLIETVWHEHFGRHPDPFVRDFIFSREPSRLRIARIPKSAIGEPTRIDVPGPPKSIYNSTVSD
jgi:hypothetical protein